ncbi:MAG TPA: GNAT family N-acetyltransferase [Actinomycetes bacterium]
MEQPYPQDWEDDVVLLHGGRVHMRPIRADDEERLREFHAKLSPESVYFRYFAPYPVLREKDVRRFTHVDYVDRVALVATIDDEIVGVGRYDRLGDPTSAEVAFIVRDDMQHRGIGSALLGHLAAAARDRGVHRFVAEVLASNNKMRSMFEDSGYAPKASFEDGYILMQFDIDVPPA